MKKAVFYSLLILLLGSTGLFWGCSKPEEAPPADTSNEPPPPPKKKPGDYVTIPAGEFEMGSDERPEKDKSPQFYEPAHKVDVPAFQISVFEITNGEYIRFNLESDYTGEGDWRKYYAMGREDVPVVSVTWKDAQAYCEYVGGRLPTEAEWEKAARGPEDYAYPWGNDWMDGVTNCNESGLGTVVEVGSIEGDVSGYGVHDMLGNAAEWTADKFKPYPKSPKRNDPNFRKGYIAVRGASFAIKGRSFKLWTRGAWPDKFSGIGFRCVKDVPSEEGKDGQ